VLDRPRALLVCPEPPYPLYGGGAFRTAAVLHYLSQHYTLDAILFSEQTRPDPRHAFPPGLVDDALLIPLPVHARAGASRTARNLWRLLRNTPPLVDRFASFHAPINHWLNARQRHYEVAIIEHFWCAPYGQTLRPHCSRLVLDLHNIESEWHTRMAKLEPWPVSAAHRHFARASRRLEADLIPRFDRILVTSERELAAPGLAHAAVYPNTIPAVPSERPQPARKEQIVFSANFEYQPNISAVKWFAVEVWPLLQRRHPGLEWVLVGRRPDAVRGWLPRIGVRTTGEVPDAWPEIAASLVALAPIHSGSGTRIKIIEAFSAGTPVVSTTLGAEGLPTESLALADTPERFAAAVSTLLTNETERQALAARGLEALNTRFTWEAGWKILNALGI